DGTEQNPVSGNQTAKRERVGLEVRGRRGWQILQGLGHVVERNDLPAAGQRGLTVQLGRHRVARSRSQRCALLGRIAYQWQDRYPIDGQLLYRRRGLGLHILGRQRGDFIFGAVECISCRRSAASDGHRRQQRKRQGEAAPTAHKVTLIASSLSWRASTSVGAPLIGSTALPVFGKASTSRNESVPHSIIHSRSTPKAHPPCGGAP